MLCVTFAVVVVWLLLVTAHGHPLVRNKRNFAMVACALVVSLMPEALGLEAKREGHAHRTRTRKYVNDIFNKLGP